MRNHLHYSLYKKKLTLNDPNTLVINFIYLKTGGNPLTIINFVFLNYKRAMGEDSRAHPRRFR